jgi:hypothetical protein
MAAPALAVGQHVLHLFGSGASPGAAVDKSKAQVVGTVTVGGSSVALWHGPNQAGGDCLYLQRAAGPGAIAGNGGGLCSVTKQPLTSALQTFVTWQSKPQGSATALVVGRYDTTEISSVELNGAAASTPVIARDGYFIAALPDASAVGTLPSGGPYVLVGRDASGAEVASVDLAALLEQSTP